MNKPRVNVTHFDTTLRDGAQSLPESMQFPDGTKPIIANMIALFGVQVIEAGFPATPQDSEEVNEVARIVGQKIYKIYPHGRTGGMYGLQRPVIAGLSRANLQDIDKTWEAIEPAVRKRIHTFVSTDEAHMKAKFPGKSPDEVLKIGVDAIKYAKNISRSSWKNSTVEFSAEAATTTDIGFLEKVVKSAVYYGADVINVPDTVGQRNPFWMRNFYAKVINWVMNENPNVVISAHNHNDIGQAVANSLALVFAAADYVHDHEVGVNVQIESTVCGIGERAGNADVFPVMAGIEKFSPEMPATVVQEFSAKQAVNTAKVVMVFSGGREVPRQSPIVGEDIKVHRSGIHSDGVLKGGHQIYTPMDPTFWGHDSDAVHEDGKYQGSRGRSHISSGGQSHGN